MEMSVIVDNDLQPWYHYINKPFRIYAEWLVVYLEIYHLMYRNKGE